LEDTGGGGLDSKKRPLSISSMSSSSSSSLPRQRRKRPNLSDYEHDALGQCDLEKLDNLLYIDQEEVMVNTYDSRMEVDSIKEDDNDNDNNNDESENAASSSCASDNVSDNYAGDVEQELRTEALEHSGTDALEQSGTDALKQSGTLTDVLEQSRTNVLEQSGTDALEQSVIDSPSMSNNTSSEASSNISTKTSDLDLSPTRVKAVKPSDLKLWSTDQGQGHTGENGGVSGVESGDTFLSTRKVVLSMSSTPRSSPTRSSPSRTSSSKKSSRASLSSPHSRSGSPGSPTKSLSHYVSYVQRVVAEIVDTERTYVNSLQDIKEVGLFFVYTERT
jgi:hypothetical protein